MAAAAPITMAPLTSCPIYAPILGALGAAAAISLTCTYSNSTIDDILYIIFLGFGAAYGTAKSGAGIAAIGVMHPELIVFLPPCTLVNLSSFLDEVSAAHYYGRYHRSLWSDRRRHDVECL